MVARPGGESVAKGPKAPLDTLAQLDQASPTAGRDKLANRARAKFISFPLAIALAELRSSLEKGYRNSVYCAAILEQDESGKLRGRYCGNRWCLVCNRVRIARAINRYLPAISQWSRPHLVTLTLPNVKADDLAATIDLMIRDIVAIGRAIRRTDKLVLRALRKLECTYNPERDDYHPHFHIAVEGAAAAEAIVGRWLALHPEASPSAQDARPCDATALRELFKYFTKLIAKTTSSGAGRMVAPAEALDVIFTAMVGRRVFQPMGFKVATPPAHDEDAEVGAMGDTTVAKRLGEAVNWEWMQSLHDWIELETGEILSGYTPTETYVALVATASRQSSASEVPPEAQKATRAPDKEGPSKN